MPSATSSIHCSTGTAGVSDSAVAESFTRAQWSFRSGVTPSNARAPSNTDEPSQAAWVRAPMSGTLPSCQSPPKNVHVFDGAGGSVIARVPPGVSASLRQRGENARPAADALVKRGEVVLLVG